MEYLTIRKVEHWVCLMFQCIMSIIYLASADSVLTVERERIERRFRFLFGGGGANVNLSTSTAGECITTPGALVARLFDVTVDDVTSGTLDDVIALLIPPTWNLMNDLRRVFIAGESTLRFAVAAVMSLTFGEWILPARKSSSSKSLGSRNCVSPWGTFSKYYLKKKIGNKWFLLHTHKNMYTESTA